MGLLLNMYAYLKGVYAETSQPDLRASRGSPDGGDHCLQALRDSGQIKAGQKVLIHGAPAAWEHLPFRLLKFFGAEVTAVCRTDKVEMVRALGAEHVIDYTKEDFTKNGQKYDLILAVNGYHPISAYKRALTPKGIYVMAGGSAGQIFQAVLFGPSMSEKGGRKLGSMNAKISQKDMAVLVDLMEAGKVVPVIDRRYPLSEAAEALRYLGEGMPGGK